VQVLLDLPHVQTNFSLRLVVFDGIIEQDVQQLLKPFFIPVEHPRVVGVVRE
jgi:hypothetical protein